MTRKIAIIGAGNAGLGCAYALHKDTSLDVDFTLYERRDYVGGHAHHAAIPTDEGVVYVDMGVILTDPWSYPNYYGILEEKQIRTHAVGWSIGVSAGEEAWWNLGAGTETPLFQRIREDASRWSLAMFKVANAGTAGVLMTLGDVLKEGGYSPEFASKALAPALVLMLVTRTGLMDTTAAGVYGLFRDRQLGFFNPNEWRLTTGGTGGVAQKIAEPFMDKVRLKAEVSNVRREGDKVTLVANGKQETYDEIVIAANPYFTLQMLDDATPEEIATFRSIQGSGAQIFVHSDTSVLSPHLPQELFSQYYDTSPSPDPNALGGNFSLNVGRAFDVPKSAGPVYLTGYNFDSPMKRPAPEKVYDKTLWYHLIFTPQAAIAISQMSNTIQGKKNTWYCGEKTTFPATEAALCSGFVIAEKLGAKYPFNPSTLPLAYSGYNSIKNSMFPSQQVRLR